MHAFICALLQFDLHKLLHILVLMIWFSMYFIIDLNVCVRVYSGAVSCEHI